MKRGPKPFLVELPLTTWMDECADQMVCPTLTEIKDEAIAMAEKKTSVQNPALPCKFGKTWWKLFKRRNSDFVSRLAQNVESQRASARLSPQQWTEFFNNHLTPGLEKAAYNPCHIWKEDESGFFRPHTAGFAKSEVLGCRGGCVPPPSDRCHPATRQSRFEGT